MRRVKEHWLYKLAFEDDSLTGWIVHLFIAFLIIKFIVYPVLGWLLGTAYPIVAVVSCSMDHHGSFDNWWQSQAVNGTQGEFYERMGISKETFLEYPIHNGFWKGDLMVLRSAKNVKKGDVIVFASPYNAEPIIHRVITVTPDVYITKGDGNRQSDPQLDRAPREYVLGKVLVRLPFAGWLKVGLIKGLCLFTPRTGVCQAQRC